MANELDDVLQRVAEGVLTPEEALAELDGRSVADPADAAGDPPAPPGLSELLGHAPGAEAPPPPDPSGILRSLKIRLPAAAVDIYADPSVAEIAVTEGSPALRREGDALVIEHRKDLSAPVPNGSFGFVASLPRILAASLPGTAQHVVLRVNPALFIDVEVSAGGVHVWGCEGGLRLRLAMSSAKLSRVQGPLTIEAMSSSVKGSVCITGDGRIDCESSSVKLGLLPGTDVRVEARNRLSKIALPARRNRRRPDDTEHLQAVIGAGTGLLTIDAMMSSVMLGSDGGYE
jgi:hypothetical protein